MTGRTCASARATAAPRSDPSGRHAGGDAGHLQRPISRAILDQVWLTTSGIFTEPEVMLTIRPNLFLIIGSIARWRSSTGTIMLLASLPCTLAATVTAARL